MQFMKDILKKYVRTLFPLICCTITGFCLGFICSNNGSSVKGQETKRVLSSGIRDTYDDTCSSKNSFFSMISRMRNIFRWSLMKNLETENLEEHSYETAVLTHALVIIRNSKFGGDLDPGKAVLPALYHDITEIITGDMPTPVKYYIPEMKEIYNKIDNQAKDELLSLLPGELRDPYTHILNEYEFNEDIHKLVKAADILSALIKCLRERKLGNTDFLIAEKNITKSLHDLCMPEVEYFMEQLLPSYGFDYK